MKLMRITMAAAAAAFLLSASLAGACGEKKTQATSGTAQLTSGGGGCGSKAKAEGASAQLTSGGGCASKAKAGEAQLTSGGGCAKGGATAASGSGCCKKGGAMNASGSGCADKAKMAGCCAKKAEPVMASIGDATDEASCKFKAGAVAFKGTVLCKHCDLKQGDACATMFKTETGCLFALSGDKAQSLREAAVGGSKLVRIKGEVDDKGALVVSTFRVVRTLDSGASAM